MARHSAGVRTTAGSTSLPLASIYSGANETGVLREVGIFNTTAVALEVFLRRLSTAGTKPAAVTRGRHNPKKQDGVCTVHGTHTVGPTLVDDMGYRGVLGAAIGAGVIWTFGDDGIMIAAPDAIEDVVNGLGILIENGSGQICQAYFVWDE